MAFATDTLTAAHRHCRENRREIEASAMCGCFYCLETFAPGKIERWLNEGAGTALCAECQIDSVIGAASGYPIGDPTFLQAMHERYFS